MPTYEYRCTANHRFEQVQNISEPPIEKCPKCGAKAQRVISGGAGLLFKGSGFYITDYRSESYKKKAKEESGESKPPKADSGGETKSTEPRPEKPKKTKEG